MNLTEEQRQRVSVWIAQGAKLAEIQSQLASEFGLKLTYMDTRFLVDDLKLVPKDPERPKTPEPAPAPKTPPAGQPGAAGTPAAGAPVPTGTGSKVSVTVDQITRPGSVVSGKVTFSDSQTAEWYLDETGRLALVAKQMGYKPSAADVQDFQIALQQEMAKLGY